MLGVAARLVMALVLLIDVPDPWTASFLNSDMTRYREIATAPGRPHQDFPVEYPPVLYAAIEVLAQGAQQPSDATPNAESLGAGSATGVTEGDIQRRLIVVALVVDLAIAGVLGWGFGARATKRYLLFGLPLVLSGMTYLRLDLLPVLFAAMGLAVHKRGRPTAAGLLWVLGAFTKLWPGVLLGILVAERRWRALAVAGSAGAIGLVGWQSWGGPDAFNQVLGMRGAGGWQVESLPGSIALAFGDGVTRIESGAWRVGEASSVVRLVLGVAGVVAVVGPWLLARRHREPHLVTASAGMVAVTGLLVTAPLLSPQFVNWLLPMIAIVPALAPRTDAVAAPVAPLAELPAEDSASDRRDGPSQPSGADGASWWKGWSVRSAPTGVAGLDVCAWIVMIFTLLVCASYDEMLAREPSAIVVLLVRNGALVALAIVGYRHLARSSTPVPVPVPEPSSTPVGPVPIEVG